jgi:hypothetical protein
MRYAALELCLVQNENENENENERENFIKKPAMNNTLRA